MTHDDDEFERLRIRAAEPRPEPPAPGPGGSPAFLGRVTSTGAALAAGNFVLVRPLTVLGAEIEGGAASISVGTGSVPVFILAGIPATGDDLICTFSDFRWTAAKSGNAPRTDNPMPNCNCTTAPYVIAMDGADPYCNSPGGTAAVPYFPSCTIRWVPTPAGYAALNLGPECYLSDQSFVDANGDTYRFHLSCHLQEFDLTRAYLASTFGSPFLDSPRFSWTIGAPGNTCNPFLMSNGVIYQGGNTTCNGTITLSPTA